MAECSEDLETIWDLIHRGSAGWHRLLAHNALRFIRDSGPFRYETRSGNFEAKVRISGKYHELYHQAGLMIRIDEKNWIKTGIEFVNGHQNVSAVVTRDYSLLDKRDRGKLPNSRHLVESRAMNYATKTLTDSRL